MSESTVRTATFVLFLALLPSSARADRPHVVMRIPNDRPVLERVDVPYPASARQRKLEGNVHITVKVDPPGKVVPAGYPLRGDYELSGPALRAVRSWTFAPAAKESWVTIDMSFRLDLAPADLFAFDGSVTAYHLGKAPYGADLGKFEGHSIRDWSPIGNPKSLPAIKQLLPKEWPPAVPAAGVRPPRSPDWALEIRTQGERDVVLFASTRTGEVYLRDEDRAWTTTNLAFARALAAHFSTLLL